jgi:hypothetical protein
LQAEKLKLSTASSWGVLEGASHSYLTRACRIGRRRRLLRLARVRTVLSRAPAAFACDAFDVNDAGRAGATWMDR